jgi:hypothetical protein
MAAAHIAGRMPFVRGGVRMQTEEGAGWMTRPGGSVIQSRYS